MYTNNLWMIRNSRPELLYKNSQENTFFHVTPPVVASRKISSA